MDCDRRRRAARKPLTPLHRAGAATQARGPDLLARRRLLSAPVRRHFGGSTRRGLAAGRGGIHLAGAESGHAGRSCRRPGRVAEVLPRRDDHWSTSWPPGSLCDEPGCCPRPRHRHQLRTAWTRRHAALLPAGPHPIACIAQPGLRLRLGADSVHPNHRWRDISAALGQRLSRGHVADPPTRGGGLPLLPQRGPVCTRRAHPQRGVALPVAAASPVDPPARCSRHRTATGGDSHLAGHLPPRFRATALRSLLSESLDAGRDRHLRFGRVGESALPGFLIHWGGSRMPLNADVSFTWVGHGTWKVRSARRKDILIDPWVMNNPVAPEKLKTVERCDLMLITHGHFDHVHDALEIARATTPKIVTIHEIGVWLTSKGINAASITAGNQGGTIDVDNIKITLVHAEHSCGISDGDQIIYGGTACGLVIEFENGFTVYFAGDTDVFGDMALIAELSHFDVAFLPIGGFYTMGPERAAKAVSLLGVKTVVPMHFGTFPILAGRPNQLQELVGSSVEVLDIKPGDTV